MVSILHALLLLASMFVLAPVMSKIPKSALAGVLMVTAWRMSDWEAIRYYFHHRLRAAILTFGITMIATFTLDLTQAILIGSFISGAIFLSQIAQLTIEITAIDAQRLRERGLTLPEDHPPMRVAYLSGPLFFAATGHFNEAFAKVELDERIILSMRGVPLIDPSGLQSIIALYERLHSSGGGLLLAGVHANVLTMLDRGGVLDLIGRENVFWGADQAILAASRRDTTLRRQESFADEHPIGS